MADMKRKNPSDKNATARSHEGGNAASSPPPTAFAGTSPDPRTPSSFARRVLLAVTGLSPQIVTETLYALAVKSAERFVPTEIVLLTTREGKERARLSLLSKDPGWFHRLRRDYSLPAIAFDESAIRLLTDGEGRELEDIRSKSDNERVADLITETVRELTADSKCALHASIAGGRKTMGFYLGYALSLYGRPQDRLSHVLVSEPFESSWEFFYPTPYERIIQTKNDKLANCRDAQVTLADIPFVRLREGLPRRLVEGKASFTAAVAAANRAVAEPRLVLDLRSLSVLADDERIDLGPTEFSVLLWLATRARSDQPDVDWASRDATEEFKIVAARVFNHNSGYYQRIEEALDRCKDDRKCYGDYFEPHKSNINKAFAEALGEHAASRYQIRRSGPRGASRYYLPLAPEQIEIKG
jgi:CRISPR-associated protein (TIGR02584 family)